MVCRDTFPPCSNKFASKSCFCFLSHFRLYQATALLWIPRPLLLPVLPWECPGGGSRQSSEEVGLQQILRQQLCPGPAEQDCWRPAFQPKWHQQWPVQEEQISGGRQGEKYHINKMDANVWLCSFLFNIDWMESHPNNQFQWSFKKIKLHSGYKMEWHVKNLKYYDLILQQSFQSSDMRNILHVFFGH